MQAMVAHLYHEKVSFYPEGHAKAGLVSTRWHWAMISDAFKELVGAEITENYLRNKKVIIIFFCIFSGRHQQVLQRWTAQQLQLNGLQTVGGAFDWPVTSMCRCRSCH